MRLVAFVFLLFFVSACGKSEQNSSVSSPDGQIEARVWVDTQGAAWYTLYYQGKAVVDSSALGVIRSDAGFSSGLAVTQISPVKKVSDTYDMLTAKRRKNQYEANEKVFQLRNAEGQGFDLTFQVSNEGVAFRYAFPDIHSDVIYINEELTSFRFPEHTKAWLQPVAVAKTGWERTNPSYEEHYQQAIAVGTPESTGTGWIYPALFNVDDVWVLLTEAGLDGQYCATRLRPESEGGEYRIGFPDEREVMSADGLLPKSDKPFVSPWRVVTIGSLATIVESNHGLHVADKAMSMDLDVIKPGKSSWSWINSKDDFITYEEQKKYIDFAADMNWQYCLIDVNWDQKIGYERIKELADYAATKNVGLLLWYNSAGDWNTVPYTPKNRLLEANDRNEEFERIKSMGIKGVKIDFFGGDGRSVIQYYIDILEDAAKHGLLVNFHGATLPRGWSRTYPHLMTVEAVRGFEMVTFGQEDADFQATLSTILPFTRNAFDPMDFTPMNLNKVYSHVQRRTTSAFELATSVLFLSGIQHYAESPEGMSVIPEEIKDFLRELPDYWDDVRFISGYPGKDVVIARKAGSRWYIAGINGEGQDKELKLDLTSLEGLGAKAVLYADGQEWGSFDVETVSLDQQLTIAVKPNGGFVLVISE